MTVMSISNHILVLWKTLWCPPVKKCANSNFTNWALLQTRCSTICLVNIVAIATSPLSQRQWWLCLYFVKPLGTLPGSQASDVFTLNVIRSIETCFLKRNVSPLRELNWWVDRNTSLRIIATVWAADVPTCLVGVDRSTICIAVRYSTKLCNCVRTAAQCSYFPQMSWKKYISIL